MRLPRLPTPRMPARLVPVAARLGDRLKDGADLFERVADRRFGFAERDDRAGLLLLALLLGHVLVWTLQPVLSHSNLADSVDMVENWVWGKEWQLGYWKHPPFFAWVTAGWFSVFPRADWAYYLLAAVNSAAGLAGVWALTGVADADREGKGLRRRLLAVAALSPTPIYGFLALKFNANAMLLSVWPWAAWAFLRALREPTARNGALLGLLAAVAMLSKYISLVLLIGMVAVALADRRRWSLLRSPAAFAALVVGALAMAPHLVWMVATEFRTLAYAEHQRATSTAQFVSYLLRLPFSMLLFLLPTIALALVALPREDWRAYRGVFRRGGEAARGRMLGLAVVPFVATCLLGVWKWAKLSSQWGFPLMYPASWLLVSAPGVEERRLRLDRAALLLVLAWGAIVVTAPVVGVGGVLAGAKVHVEPRAELGREVTRIWREASGGRALDVVAGTFDLSNDVAFYSPDAPSMLIDFDRLKSPWVTPERMAANGVAVVCRLDDAVCAEAAVKDLGADPTPREVTVAKSRLGLSPKPLTVRLFLRLPGERT